MTDERAAIVHDWTRRAEQDRVLPRDAASAVAEVAGWVTEALASAEELSKLVALHGRAAGFEGVPASVVALRLGALEDAWRTAAPASFDGVQASLRTALRVALDAHGLGAAEARDARHHRAIRDMTPIFRTRGDRVVALLLGPMIPELIDAAMARILHETAAAETSAVVIDLLGAAPDDERFHHTVAALLREPPLYKRTVILSGLADPVRTKAGLAAAGADLERIRFAPRLSDVLSG